MHCDQSRPLVGMLRMTAKPWFDVPTSILLSADELIE